MNERNETFIHVWDVLLFLSDADVDVLLLLVLLVDAFLLSLFDDVLVPLLSVFFHVPTEKNIFSNHQKQNVHFMYYKKQQPLLRHVFDVLHVHDVVFQTLLQSETTIENKCHFRKIKTRVPLQLVTLDVCMRVWCRVMIPAVENQKRKQNVDYHVMTNCISIDFRLTQNEVNKRKQELIKEWEE